MSAYVDALKMLARRELSEAQVRERLERRRHAPEEIDDAVARLREERAIDDTRVAEAIARTQATLKRRGEARVRRQIEQAGIASETARIVARDVSEAADPDALLEASLSRRLRGRSTIEDEAEFARLFRYLLSQGFDPDRIRPALERRQQRS